MTLFVGQSSNIYINIDISISFSGESFLFLIITKHLLMGHIQITGMSLCYYPSSNLWG